MIKVEGLNKYYNKNKSNEIHVIDNVTLELPSQGLVSFLGASGSGKTTLLNVIGGLDKATGTLIYDSFEMKKYDMKRIDRFRNEHFGYVFQSYNLLLEETVYDNLKIALELIDIYDPDEVTARIEYALRSVGMYKYRKKRASQLSGGQQQRVAIARALVKHCKVIIADEPTGNLDSANAVEVMNILKRISKKTLVLLVTHNEALADFYSDYIYRIEDGRIVDEKENSGTASLDAADDNVIYLKDMKLVESDSDAIKVKLYSDEEKSIELEIVERNNTFYVRSNRNLKLMESSNIKLLNEHYKPTEKTDVKEYDGDDSFFNNSPTKRNVWQNFLSLIKRSFISFIHPTKKVRAIYSSLVMIGVLFSICAISVSNAIKVDTDRIHADDSYYTLADGFSEFNIFDDGEIIEAGLKAGQISSVQMVFYNYTTFEKMLNLVEVKRYEESFHEMYFDEGIHTLVCGRAPVGDEIAISSGLADDLLEEYSDCYDSYEDLFDLSVDLGNLRMVGIVDNPHLMIYVNEAKYLENVTLGTNVDDDLRRYYDYEKKYASYEIVAGRDLTDADRSTPNVLISEDYPDAQEVLGNSIPEGTVVGIYRLKNVKGSPREIIVNKDYDESEKGVYKYSYDVEKYTVVEGRAPEKENECLVSIYSGLEVGDSFDGYSIVGRYNARTQLLRAEVLLSTSVLSIDNYSVKAFVVEDEEAFAKTLNDSFELKTMYGRELYNLQQSNNRKMTVYLLLGILCLIATSILVFFLMRSRMVNDIYNIGVYRSLGSNKKKIYAKYFSDTVVMVTFTSLIAYAIVIFVYVTAISSINDYFGSELFNRGLGIPILGIFVLYAVNVVFGLLPIVTLLRKTPSEILTKYDI